MKRQIVIALLILSGIAGLSFSFSESAVSASMLLNRLAMINPSSATREQKIDITTDGFFRLRRKFTNGKQEYFSFHFSRFKELGYLGNDTSGNVRISVADTNIIVQTFQDPKGNIDSMASTLQLDLRSATAEDLSALNGLFRKLQKENLAVKEATNR